MKWSSWQESEQIYSINNLCNKSLTFSSILSCGVVSGELLLYIPIKNHRFFKFIQLSASLCEHILLCH